MREIGGGGEVSQLGDAKPENGGEANLTNQTRGGWSLTLTLRAAGTAGQAQTGCTSSRHYKHASTPSIVIFFKPLRCTCFSNPPAGHLRPPAITGFDFSSERSTSALVKAWLTYELFSLQSGSHGELPILTSHTRNPG